MSQVQMEPSEAVSTIGQLGKPETTLPVERWQATVSEAIRYYAQIYHLSLGATFTGQSTSRDESGGLRFLEEYESQLRENAGPLADASQVTAAAAKLLGVPQTMKPEPYAFAVAHWIKMLSEVYPAVMHYHGSEIIKPVVSKKLGKTYLKAINATHGTVGDLLTFFRRPLPTAFEQSPEREELKVDGIERYTEAYGGSSEFVASVALDECLPEQGQPPPMTDVPRAAAAHQIRALSAAEACVRKVTVSDLDRPSTQFGTAQQSHTVAWTLVRAELTSFANSPLTGLLEFLDAQFSQLAEDVASEEGQALVNHAQTQLDTLRGSRQPIHIWQRDASLLVNWYAHAHQLATSTTYVDTRTLGEARGHGEPSHMKVLMANEASAHEHLLVNPRERVIEAVIKLLDVYAGSPSQCDHR